MSVNALGVFRADEIYPLPELKRISGWGDAAVRSARKAGLQPIYLHGRVFYLGSAVVDYISKAADEEAGGTVDGND